MKVDRELMATMRRGDWINKNVQRAYHVSYVEFFLSVVVIFLIVGVLSFLK